MMMIFKVEGVLMQNRQTILISDMITDRKK